MKSVASALPTYIASMLVMEGNLLLTWTLWLIASLNSLNEQGQRATRPGRHAHFMAERTQPTGQTIAGD